jgi:hypothetical protein
MPQVIIATALLLEARVIARAFLLPVTRAPSPASAKGPFESPPSPPGAQPLGPPTVQVVTVGPRGRQLDILRKIPAHGLIMAGLGGALAPTLRIGDVVVHGDVPATFPGFSHRLFVGPIATTEQIVTTPHQKAALFERTGALAVDMETAAAKFVAESLQIPFLAVRAISDTAAQELDAGLLGLVDQEGRLRPGRAIGVLARQPWRLPGMLALRRASRIALLNLAATVEAIVRAGWPRTA